MIAVAGHSVLPLLYNAIHGLEDPCYRQLQVCNFDNGDPDLLMATAQEATQFWKSRHAAWTSSRYKLALPPTLLPSLVIHSETALS